MEDCPRRRPTRKFRIIVWDTEILPKQKKLHVITKQRVKSVVTLSEINRPYLSNKLAGFVISRLILYNSMFMASGSAQRLSCEPRQIGNEATAAISVCVAVKSEAANFS